jgi:hypothetical protein
VQGPWDAEAPGSRPGASFFEIWNRVSGVASNSHMTGFLALGGLLLAGFAFLSLMLAFVIVFFKAVLWLVFLPFRLLFWTLGAVLALIGTAVGVVVALVVGLALILAPLLPFLVLGALIYGLVRLIKRPATT